ncbi:MAG: lysine--tRNA ligase [Candidatus Omnitrophica bacterium]|nr:lysine--tRNA ligase [Candidatus Omnitrophota bacterium]MCM8810813.1 lysine--tRNA ligase [Candidatus Omnitrophota bacterium]
MVENQMRDFRVKKLEELKNLKLEVYGRRFAKTNISEVKEQGFFKIAGRIMSIRKHGNASFADIVDSSGKIQVYFRKDIIGEENYEIFKKIDIGDIIGIEGDVFKTKTGEKTILVKNFTILSKSLRPLPEKWHGLKDVEIRFRKRYLDLMMNENVKDIFKKRIEILKYIREFLNNKGFVEVETPMMHPIPGGAEAKPFITYHNTLDIELYLRIAPELYLKRLLVGNFEKIYEINRSFRNEGISTLHNPEFTMLELYSAYGDYEEMIEITEQLICFLSEKIFGSNTFEYQGKKIDLTTPWKKIKYSDVFKEVGIIDHRDEKVVNQKVKEYEIEIENNDTIFDKLEKIFKKKIQPFLINPTFIVDYPVEISPLAKTSKDNSEIAERFELFIGGIEVANAYSELNDPIEQLKRFEEKFKNLEDKEKKIDYDFIEALEYGMPPAGGLGIGIDRLVMLFTNSSSIREVIFFPLLKPKNE